MAELDPQRLVRSLSTWRIILISKWLGSPTFISHETAIWKRQNPTWLTSQPWSLTTYKSWDDRPSTLNDPSR